MPQEYEWKKSRIASLSRALTSQQRSRLVRDKELSSVVWSTEQLRLYFEGAPFVLRTGHDPVTFFTRRKLADDDPRVYAGLITFKDLVLTYSIDPVRKRGLQLRYRTSLATATAQQAWLPHAVSDPTIRDKILTAYNRGRYSRSLLARLRKGVRVKQFSLHGDLTWWRKEGALYAHVPVRARVHVMHMLQDSLNAATQG